MNASWTVDPPPAARQRSAVVLALAWCFAAAAGGAIGGLAGDVRLCAAASALSVALLQAALLGSDLRYGGAWFLASSVAGTAGMFLTVTGGLALQEVSASGGAVGEGLVAWIVLGGLGGLFLAATQAPLTGRRSLAITWLLLGLLGGAVLWPLGLWLGYRLGPGIGASLGALELGIAEADLTGTASRVGGFSAAWLLHALPFSLVFASAERR